MGGVMNQLFNYVTNLLANYGGAFTFVGQTMFRALATILIAWFGVKAALASSEHAGGFHFSRFASLVMTIAFGFGMITYYDNPIPGIGYSFHNLITREGSYLYQIIAGTELDNADTAIQNAMAKLQFPGTDILADLYYLLDVLIMALWDMVAMIVTAYGFVAQAICVLLGPIFVPFFIVPQLDWIFWGWLKCLVQYSFYQVVAGATMYVIGNLVIAYLGSFGTILPPPDALFAPLCLIFLGGAYALLKVPTLTNQIFSGNSGTNSGSDLYSFVRSFV